MILSLLLIKMQEEALRLRNRTCGLFPLQRGYLYLFGRTQYSCLAAFSQ
jgi:hypothetical protein